MQSYEENKLVGTFTGTKEELLKQIGKFFPGEATHHVISKVSEKGEIVTINGLRYKVKSSDGIKGVIKAVILRPKA